MDLRLLLPVRGLAVRNSQLISPLSTKPIYHWFRRWLFALSAPSHYLKQCRKLSIGLLEKNISEFLSTFLYIIQENEFEHVICGMAAILVLVTWVLVLKLYTHMSLGKYTLTHYDALRSMLIFVTHWGHLTHICIGDSTIIVSDNGLSPNRRQAIFWTEMGILMKFQAKFKNLHSWDIFQKVLWQKATNLYRSQCIVISIRPMFIHTEDTW